MGKKDEVVVPEQEAAEPSIAEQWASYAPGARIAKGIFSIYKTPDGGMHISYRREGDEEDSHLPVPGAMVAMMMAASEGKGPMGRMKAIVAAKFGG